MRGAKACRTPAQHWTLSRDDCPRHNQNDRDYTLAPEQSTDRSKLAHEAFQSFTSLPGVCRGAARLRTSVTV